MLVTVLVLSRLDYGNATLIWIPASPVSSSPICAQRRCPIRRWSSSLRPHHWDARQASLAVRVWVHTIQAGDVGLQIVAWIGSTVSGRRPYPRVADMPSRHRLRSARTHRLDSSHWRYRECGVQPSVTEDSVWLVPNSGTACPACRRLPDCWYIPSSAEIFLF